MRRSTIHHKRPGSDGRIHGSRIHFWFRIGCIFGFGLGLLFHACNRQGQDIGAFDEEERILPSQEGWNSELVVSESGRIQAVVRYGYMRKYDSRKVVYFDEGVEVDFYNIDGDRTSYLTSKRGEYHEDSEDVLGQGNVVVVSDSGMTLHTESLRWKSRIGKIISDTTVMVTTQEQDTVYGVGFESEPDLTRWIIKKPWGVGNRRVDIEQFEESILNPPKQAYPDSSVERN